ncbi:hypothetical protein ACFQRB_11130 [Halobaculum litoreum]|uniref:Uncharacterized protein n=1 Tax=Halobaculum litoreum TaxID=3031998 RepID=A0ABD5XXW2_9EURY
MTSHLATAQLVTVLLALAGAGIALAAGIGLVAVYVRLGDAVTVSDTRRAFGLWAAGTILLAAGTPGAVRGASRGSTRSSRSPSSPSRWARSRSAWRPSTSGGDGVWCCGGAPTLIRAAARLSPAGRSAGR